MIHALTEVPFGGNGRHRARPFSSASAVIMAGFPRPFAALTDIPLHFCQYKYLFTFSFSYDGYASEEIFVTFHYGS